MRKLFTLDGLRIDSSGKGSRTMTDDVLTESPEHLSKRLNLPFDDFFLLTRALTHRSYLNENKDAIEDNERLEFLGDAVLDFMVAEWLYNHYVSNVIYGMLASKWKDVRNLEVTKSNER